MVRRKRIVNLMENLLCAMKAAIDLSDEQETSPKGTSGAFGGGKGISQQLCRTYRFGIRKGRLSFPIRLCGGLGCYRQVLVNAWRLERLIRESGTNFRVADHLDTIARGGGWSFRTWCYSGKSRLMIPHQSVAHCPGRLKTPRAQRWDRSTWEE